MCVYIFFKSLNLQLLIAHISYHYGQLFLSRKSCHSFHHDLVWEEMVHTTMCVRLCVCTCVSASGCAHVY